MFVHSLLICIVWVSNSKSNKSLATEVSGLRKMSDEEKHDPKLLATKYLIMKSYWGHFKKKKKSVNNKTKYNYLPIAFFSMIKVAVWVSISSSWYLQIHFFCK